MGKISYIKILKKNNGSVLITLIVIMVIFAILAAAMYSLTTSSMFSHLHTLATTRATYLAKSGYNYLASQYKNATSEAERNSVLENLHNQTFQLLNNEGSFQLDVKPYYLVSQQNLTITNANNLRLNVKFPGDVSYNIPSSSSNKAMAVYTSNGWRRFYYTTVTVLGANSYQLRLSNSDPPDGQPIQVNIGTSIVPVLSLSSSQTVTSGGNLTLATGTGGIFPERFGFFEMPLVAAAADYVFYYDRRVGDTLYDIRDASTPARTFSYSTSISTRLLYAHTSAHITSTGTLSAGLGPAVSATFSRPAILGYEAGGVPPIISGVDGWVTIGTGVAIDTGDEVVELGRSLGDTAGVAYYAGNSEVANCQDGLCDFGVGIRAYFQFRDSTGSSSSGDGFMFMIMNGTNNDTTKRGGTPSGAGMGELMGYAGPGNSTDGLGLQPPKISIEFDSYHNSGISTPPGCGFGRNDTAGNHMALMFWGDNTPGNCSNGYPAVSYDDNIHSAGVWGSSTVPRNSASGDSTADGSRGYYVTSFANTNTRSFRIEITRAATPNMSGNYHYNIRAWIDCSACNDVSVAYSGPSTAQINRTVELTPTLHSYFNKMFFGFTQGTGGATQRIEISNFEIFFPPY